MLENITISLKNLQILQKAVPLQCVFHSIRFKVNKGWSTAVLLFFALLCGMFHSFIQLFLCALSFAVALR